MPVTPAGPTPTVLRGVFTPEQQAAQAFTTLGTMPFDDLREGQAVSFTAGQAPKGARAENVIVR